MVLYAREFLFLDLSLWFERSTELVSQWADRKEVKENMGMQGESQRSYY